MMHYEALIDIALRIVGAFYVIAGIVAARAAVMSSFLDRALAAITLEEQPATGKETWLLAGALLVMAGGAALILRLDLALWLFAASALGQASYIYYVAPRHFDPADPPDEQGRRQTRNAFVVYVAATALVTWAWLTGRLAPWRETDTIVLLLAGGIVGGVAAYWARQFAKARSKLAPATNPNDARPDGQAEPSEPLEPLPDPATSRRIAVMADQHCFPLWARDPGISGNIDPAALHLSEGLTRDLTAWADAYTAAVDLDDPAATGLTDAEGRAHLQVGRALAQRLANERPDLLVCVHTLDGEIPVPPDPVRDARDG